MFNIKWVIPCFKRSIIVVLLFIFNAEVVKGDYVLTKQISEKLKQVDTFLLTEPNDALSTVDSLLLHQDLSDQDYGAIYLKKGWIQYKGLMEKDKSINSFYKALKYFRKTRDLDKQCLTLLNLGHAYRDLYRYNYAMEYYQKILLLEPKDHTYKIHAHYNIAHATRLNEAYDEAIIMQLQVVPMCVEENMTTVLVRSYLELGVCFARLEKWEIATEYYKDAFKLIRSSQIEQKGFEAKIYNSLGFISMKEYEFQLASDYFNKALEMSLLDNDNSLSIIVYNNLGNLALLNEKLEEAHDYYSKSISLDVKSTDFKQYIAALSELESISIKQNRTEDAYYYSRRQNEVTAPFVDLNEKLEMMNDQSKADQVLHNIEVFELEEQLYKTKTQIRYGIIIMMVILIIWGYSWFSKKRKVDAGVIGYLKERDMILRKLSDHLKLDEKTLKEFVNKP
ncbi:MAG: tetratricopeptide repeat protein [Cyclobacteriaceae bacterium]